MKKIFKEIMVWVSALIIVPILSISGWTEAENRVLENMMKGAKK